MLIIILVYWEGCPIVLQLTIIFIIDYSADSSEVHFNLRSLKSQITVPQCDLQSAQ